MSKKQEVNIKDIVISEHGSLALLALGSVGLRIWREKKAEAQKASKIEKKKNASKK